MPLKFIYTLVYRSERQGRISWHTKKNLLNLLNSGALQFGEYTLKSGRKSPYFFNSGVFKTGSAMSRLGEFYAHAIVESKISFDMLFGPAYKGIPLVTSTAIALSQINLSLIHI